MQGGSTHGHRSGNDIDSGLIVNIVSRPGIFTIVFVALAIFEAILEIKDRLACFDDYDLAARSQLRKLLSKQSGGYSAADDTNVRFVNLSCRQG
jgi:hypothetical protein